jgi:hypothetical protein
MLAPRSKKLLLRWSFAKKWSLTRILIFLFFIRPCHEKAPVENLEEEKQRESGVPTNR